MNDITVEPEPPRIAPARAPPPWGDCFDALADERRQIGLDLAISWAVAAQLAPDFDVGHRINWCASDAQTLAAAG